MGRSSTDAVSEHRIRSVVEAGVSKRGGRRDADEEEESDPSFLDQGDGPAPAIGAYAGGFKLL